jgi:hypothetical protein
MPEAEPSFALVVSFLVTRIHANEQAGDTIKIAAWFGTAARPQVRISVMEGGQVTAGKQTFVSLLEFPL